MTGRAVGRVVTGPDLLAFLDKLKEGLCMAEVARIPGMMAENTFRRYMAKMPALDRVARQYYKPKENSIRTRPEMAARVQAGTWAQQFLSPKWDVLLSCLRKGMSLNAALTRPDTPNVSKYYRRMKGIEAFRKSVRTAMDTTEEGRAFREKSEAQLRKHIARAVANVPAVARDEIAAEMLVAALEYKISRKKPELHTKKFVSAYWKNNPSKYGPQSLDAPAYRDGTMALHETIEKGLWDD